MYETFIQSIKTTLGKVGSVREIYGYPVTKVDNYPAVVFVPDSTENQYSSTAANMETVRFRMWIIVGTENINDEIIFETLLPQVTDDVIKQFNTDWDGGDINGGRVWSIIESGTWAVSSNQRGT